MNQRRRALQILILLLVIAAGLASRKYPQVLPSFLGKYPGDALWALAAFVLWGLIRVDIEAESRTAISIPLA